jgi:hypothetical protein
MDLDTDPVRIGALLVLAGEEPLPARRAAGLLAAARALRQAGEHGYALEQVERALEIAPDDAGALGERALCAAPPQGMQDGERARPRQVILFSGHMADAPGRDPPRFPNAKVPAAAQRIAGVLDRLGAGRQDLALTQGASGGDLLFAEACQARGVPVQLLLPLPEAEFVERSILPSAEGERWRERYLAVRDRCTSPPRIMPDELGPPPGDGSPFERCNLWLLYTALAHGADRVRCVCLWNGGGGDGPGGTAHMVGEIRRRTGRVSWIDTREL